MKKNKLIFIILILLISLGIAGYGFSGPVISEQGSSGGTIDDTAYDATTWDTNTDGATKNAIRDKIETMGAGDVTEVGDCTSGACLDGSSDGGTYTRLYDGTANYLQIDVNGALGSNKTVYLNDIDISDFTNLTVDSNELTLTGDSIGLANHDTARSALGLAIGTDVQAWDAQLADIADIVGVEGDILYFDGSNWVALPKGIAGQVLEMNAGATAPEWDTDDTGSATALDDIGDPDAATAINMDDNEPITLTSAEKAGTVLTIDITESSLSGVTSGIDIKHAVDGSDLIRYIRFYDKNGTDLVFEVGANGNTELGSLEARTGIRPESADGCSLGSATKEFGNLYLADGGVIYGENDQSNTLTSSATGWAANLNLSAIGGFTSGVDDTTKGQITLYGDNADAGAFMRWYNSVNEDGTEEYWDMEAQGLYFWLGIAGNADAFIFSNAGNFTAEGNVAGATYASDASVTDAELKYINSLSSNAQDQLDARCLESVFGTAISTGLTLDGTDLKTHAALQSIAGLTETSGGILYTTADNAYAMLGEGTNGYVLAINTATHAPYWKEDANSGATAWDDLVVPDANESLDHTDYYTEWDFGDTDHDMFTIFATEAFGDYSVMRIEQKTGDPTDGDLLSLVTADAEAHVDNLVLANGEDDWAAFRQLEDGTLTLDITTDGTPLFSFQDPITSTGLGTFKNLSINNTDTSAGYIDIYEDTDNGSHYVRLLGPPSLGANITVSLPAAAGTLLNSDGSGASLTGIPLDSDFGSNGLMERTGAGTYGIATAGTDYTTPASSESFTNKTFDSNATGNVFKSYGYIQLIAPHLAGAGLTAGMDTTNTNEFYGQVKFANDVDEATNYCEYRLVVPPDIDTSVDLYAWFKFRLGGADTGDHDYVISSDDVADSADYTGTVANAINLAYTADGSGADGDVETAEGTLTDWKSNLTAGNLWVIRVARDGDDGANDASTVDSYSSILTIRYGKTQ